MWTKKIDHAWQKKKNVFFLWKNDQPLFWNQKNEMTRSGLFSKDSDKKKWFWFMTNFFCFVFWNFFLNFSLCVCSFILRLFLEKTKLSTVFYQKICIYFTFDGVEGAQIFYLQLVFAAPTAFEQYLVEFLTFLFWMWNVIKELIFLNFENWWTNFVWGKYWSNRWVIESSA